MTARADPRLTPRKALCRLQSIGYALEELSILSETATAKDLTSTLYVLSQVVEESTMAMQPLLPKHAPPKIDREA
ncbi:MULTISPECIES: hypothetical protein [unclassified Pseudodesulfovibrio]|uniref:hypothetical protein n=1 Tax=unclassified Pseudodesulfovibrio TaxID=2661612 RepID=UPI000FEBD306|nr:MULTISPECIES: hypothetical protein [unclassified Pseudodesulfovibrio]MCJ2164673.1 hypothetical protein [Pseudodesulfovibrio sp. S3-i]RWU04135.1 hypothetical protein DWB63_09010 [Pseudodesulfovibrio sp. S3]